MYTELYLLSLLNSVTNGNSSLIVDPASDYTNLWNAYDPIKISQFNYFRVK